MEPNNSKSSNPLILKIIIGGLFVILPVIAFIGGREYQSNYSVKKVEVNVDDGNTQTKPTDTDTSYSESVLYSNETGTKRIVVRQDKTTSAGDLYFISNYIDKKPINL